MRQLAENQVVRVRRMGPRFEASPDEGWMVGSVAAVESGVAVIHMPGDSTLCLLVSEDGRTVAGMDGSEWELEVKIARSGEIDRVQP